MEENIIKSKKNQSLKIQLSLASLMFFSPFVVYLLKNNDAFEIEESEEKFIRGYISLGTINIVLLILSLISGLSAYFYQNPIIDSLYYIFAGLLIGSLIIGCICAITEIEILSGFKLEKGFDTKNITTNKFHIILSYLPFYQIYYRYTKHDFDNPDILIKESIFLRFSFMISCFITNPIFTIILGIIIITRIVTLIGKINIVPSYISDFISSLFYKNIEEIRGYIRGSLVFVLNGKFSRSNWKLLVENQKKEYTYLYDIKKYGSIQRQFLLLLISIAFVLRQVDLGNISGLAIVAIILILGRYGIMLLVWGRSPAIPFFREITLFVKTIINPFISKK